MSGGARWKRQVRDWANGRGPKRANTWATGAVVSVPRAMPQRIVYSRPYSSTVRRVVPGFTRRAGFYGKYNLPGGNGELKYLETVLQHTPTVDALLEYPSTGPCPNNIPTGTGPSQRIGRKVVVKSIWMRGTVRLLATNIVSQTIKDDDTFVLILILDKQANGAPASAGDVFTSAATADRFPRLDQSDRFQVLRTIKRKLTIPNQSPGGGQVNRASATLDFYHKCNIPIEFSSTTGATAEIKSNNLFWLCGGSFAGTFMQMDAVSRIRYDDS